MALGSHLITVRRLKKYINDVIGKKANLPDTSKTIIGNISQINSDLTNNTCTNLINPTARTQTSNGVTFTNNGDGTYTVNGTANGRDALIMLVRFNDISVLENTKLVGCPAGGENPTYRMYMSCYNDSARVKEYNDYGNGAIISNIPAKANVAMLYICIRNGVTCNNLLFKPMLTTDLNATYDDFVGYTGGSGRLNEDVQKIYGNLMPNYFQLTSSGSSVNIEQQDCWCQGNRIHIAFSATSSADMPISNAWAIVPNEHRGRGTRTCGFVHIDGISDMRINSIMVDGVESGYIYQRLNSNVPPNTRVTFIGDYFLFN